jgi:hypothetical protein
MKKLLLLGFLGLAACGQTQVVTTPTLAPLAPVAAPVVSPLVLNSVQFKVLNSADIQALAESLDKSKSNVVIFTLTPQQYKNLMLNLNSINGYMQQQDEVAKLFEQINAERSSEATLPSK